MKDSEDFKNGYRSGYLDAMKKSESDRLELASSLKQFQTILRIAELSYDPELTIQSLYSEVCNQLANIIDTTNFYIARVRESRTMLHFEYFKDELGMSSEFPQDFPTRPIRKGFTEYVLEKRDTVVLNDEEMASLCESGERDARNILSKSWLGSPLIADGVLLGVMVVQDYENESKFQESDVQIFKFVSKHIASAIVRYEKKLEEQLENKMLKFASQFDSLTGLYNRDSLNRRISEVLNTEEICFSLLFIDLDGFKDVNDIHGHNVGDALLKIIAKTMKSLVREKDMVCRLGGDEFVILIIDQTEETSPLNVAKRLLQLFSIPVQVENRNVKIGTSIGIIADTKNYNSVKSLIAAADTAMYQAKRGGKHRYSFIE
jgi:diguanylate cyclase (GGDEF)-like protein